jgi:hypothetical protein
VVVVVVVDVAAAVETETKVGVVVEVGMVAGASVGVAEEDLRVLPLALLIRQLPPLPQS